MKFVAGLAALALMTVPAFAAPTAVQKAEFHAVCMGIAQDETLCSCKADAAMTLIDERFMAMVIAAMQGHPLFGHVTFSRSERSPIAALVTSLLDDPRA